MKTSNPKFQWKDRPAAVARMVAYVECTQLTYDEAENVTFHTLDESGAYKYLSEPHRVTEPIRRAFRRDVDKQLGWAERYLEKRRQAE